MAPVKWEYRAIELMDKLMSNGTEIDVPWVSLDTVNRALAQAGSEGWELVSATPLTNYHGMTWKVALFFKRQA